MKTKLYNRAAAKYESILASIEERRARGESHQALAFFYSRANEWFLLMEKYK